jgi:hypothetical protein
MRRKISLMASSISAGGEWLPRCAGGGRLIEKRIGSTSRHGLEFFGLGILGVEEMEERRRCAD